jgi:hypothetical protein
VGSINVAKWLPCYEPFCESRDRAVDFMETVENVSVGDTRHPAKILMHQVQRLVALADDISSIRKDNETLPLLFLVICAENFAKTFDHFEGEGRSRAYVRNFFDWFSSESDLRKISGGITNHAAQGLPIHDAVDALYSVRCDLVHEGRYWGFHFHDGDTATLMCDPDVIVSISMKEFRDIIVRSGIRGIQSYPTRPNKSLEGAHEG